MGSPCSSRDCVEILVSLSRRPHACRNNDVQAIKDICSLPGLRLSSDIMKDNLGRTEK